MLRLLHTADWHLGRRFPSFAEEAERKLTRARVDVLERIFGLAERRMVHAVLCAGDLFDDPVPLPEWWEPLVEQLTKRSWKERPVFLLPGNHDPLLADSIWAKGSKFRSALPSWVHVVDKELFEFELPGHAVLHAVPCTSKAGQRDPTELIPTRAAGDSRIRIGMVHGSTFDMRDCQTNFPISRDAAIDRGLDYLAIGDTHGFRFVPPDRREPPTVYPGAPEPTAFDERDPGKVVIVSVNRRRKVSVETEVVAAWKWEEHAVTSMAELRQLRARTDLERSVVRLRIDMCVPAPEYEEAGRLLEELGGTAATHGRAGILQLDRTGLVLDTATIDAHCADLPDVLQSVVRRLRAEADAAEASDPRRAQIARRALVHLYQVTRKAS
ncbi:exonuclease SbcCD subunit D [Pendulispora albinea]|uniref:DNA repair exonuclease n=1 Tax=Pendulispora albinea TaxID=2741071 RepID=A0ABZ2M6A3_9BACT